MAPYMAKGDTKSGTFSSGIRERLCTDTLRICLMAKSSSSLWLSAASESYWPILEALKKSDLMFTTLMVPFTCSHYDLWKMNIYFWFWSIANQKYQKVRKSRKWKECLVLSITVDTWPWMPDKSGAVSGAKACRAPNLLKKPARKAGKSKASKLSTVRLFSQKFINFSINSKTKAYLLQGQLPTVVMTTSKLIFTGRHSGHIII